ncbi:hypothetical protein B0A48_16468 [Cryoendolithus antarcticus]|uniref:Fatty acid hydroxylase domain-containing protein n=1 Tax=Cryoendolithus antarcticus TaxID=1507870 RepID=A0A1V8SEN0_9PEZI|nr:hypothetical protein B0A48_16468 [Cryoendolithus antarcticus]
MANLTSPYALPPLPEYTLYPLPPLLPWISDAYLGPALLVIAYWAMSGLFHAIDSLDLFPQYRLHTPAEVLKRNHVSRWEVLRDVVIQQVIQTGVGIALTVLDKEAMGGREEWDVAWWAQWVRRAQWGIPGLLSLVGLDAKGMSSGNSVLSGALAGGVYPELTQVVLQHGQEVVAPAFANWEIQVAKAIYHLGIPAVQFAVAILIVDTWQYFLHRAMHMNKWMYTTWHSRHHRLYVPYAYGALYNHPFEGFLLDTCGAALGYALTGMTTRQSMWFFTISTIKTVDDHCGYAFPWDPLQHLTSNNAGYHDVHHQSWGIKTNFSQPFFTFWDTFLGTKWVGGDVSARYERARLAAQKKVDTEYSNSITGSVPSDSVSQNTAPYTSDVSNASSTARTTHSVAQPAIPRGKALYQAAGGRQQVLDDSLSTAGGRKILAEEAAEEVLAQQALRRSVRKRSQSSASAGLKGFADRVGESLQGKGTGVLGVENGR